MQFHLTGDVPGDPDVQAHEELAAFFGRFLRDRR